MSEAVGLIESKREQLILVEQLPIIKNQLMQLKPEIQKMVDEALALEVNEETVGEIKKARARLNKKFTELETRRAQIRDSVSAPYEAFMQVYKDCVTYPFKKADAALGSGVKSVEDELKLITESEIRNHFAEYAASVGHPDIPYERAGINVTLSASKKSLKEKSVTFIDRIASEKSIILEMDFADEIMVEYNKAYMLKASMDTVKQRHKEIEEAEQRRQAALIAEQQRKEAAAALAATVARQKREDAPEERPIIITAPVEEKVPESTPVLEKDPNEIVTVSFTVTTSRAKIRALREFMIQEGIKYGR